MSWLSSSVTWPHLTSQQTRTLNIHWHKYLRTTSGVLYDAVERPSPKSTNHRSYHNHNSTFQTNPGDIIDFSNIRNIRSTSINNIKSIIPKRTYSAVASSHLGNLSLSVPGWRDRFAINSRLSRTRSGILFRDRVLTRSGLQWREHPWYVGYRRRKEAYWSKLLTLKDKRNNNSILPFDMTQTQIDVNRSEAASVAAATLELPMGMMDTETIKPVGKEAEADFVQPIVLPNGTYDNPWSTWTGLPTFGDMWKMMKQFNFNFPTYPENITQSELEHLLPVTSPDIQVLLQRVGVNEDIRTTWLGHSTVLVQMDTLNLITDPHFSDRASASQYFGGVKRYRPPPCQIQDLPKIDVVLLSHNHYDHLDYNSMKGMEKHHKPVYYVPYGLRKWMLGNIVCERDQDRVVELKWWESSTKQFSVKNTSNETADVSFDFVFTPAQHWSTRNGFDRNTTMWGSWVSRGPTKSFFFTGDTGYCPVFQTIGKHYGPFDLSAIPIGAYEPRWFMSPQHVNPEEAMKIHHDLRSKRSLGIHWGTFVLTSEMVMEPKDRLAELRRIGGMGEDEFFVLKHGEHKVLRDS